MTETQFKIGGDGVSLKKRDWEAQIDESIEKKLRRWALIGVWLLLSVVIGYLISTIWELNGKVYEVSGKQTIQYDVIDEMKVSISNLKNKNEELKNIISTKENEITLLKVELTNEKQLAKLEKIKKDEVSK